MSASQVTFHIPSHKTESLVVLWENFESTYSSVASGFPEVEQKKFKDDWMRTLGIFYDKVWLAEDPITTMKELVVDLQKYDKLAYQELRSKAAQVQERFLTQQIICEKELIK
eukprot:CAMPEP_0198223698 /NCGR_PEP_ID=MMETSP1445-20131203/93603_1 /TAXON_ID=36898 /ORGANISM="Pyramimonas sp., Strain CCMP2087" /LENGTH=111 /DNA_ID=CAMNT_0043902613 /DNA_START=345 /DNA_END=677 /DNA_ORIENTATION=-